MAKTVQGTPTPKKVEIAIDKIAENLKNEKVDKTNKKVITEVIIHRELKYIYPKNCKDTLARKAFRQKVRNELRSLERRINESKGQEKVDLKQTLQNKKQEVLANA